MSKREDALNALLGQVDTTVSDVTFTRNEQSITNIPKNGKGVLLDGDPGEPEEFLSPTSYYWSHMAEMLLFVQEKDAKTRDQKLADIASRINAAISADDTLGGVVERAQAKSLETDVEEVEGGQDIKGGILTILLEYETTSPIG